MGSTPRECTISRVRATATIAALAFLALARPAGACAPAPPPGAVVQIAEESAIIAWDAKARREHFVRRASFRSTGKDFGFLVPTPDTPELAEVPDDVFWRLEQATRPEVRYESTFGGVEPTLFCGLMFLTKASRAVPEGAVAHDVRVLAEQRVAGYDAVVLEADSAGALAAWLKKHGYAERPELSAWLAPYVAAKWKITAFKIAPPVTMAEAQAVSTAAVRMSFTTDRPFFPYREPSDQRENLPASVKAEDRARLLRVFFLGNERVDGAIEGTAAPWPGKAIWSDHYTPDALPFSVPQNAWLTMFEDRASPRPGTDDVFFSPARDRSPVKPPPVVVPSPWRIPLPLDVIALVGLGVWYARRRARRAKGA